jgi:hypothetical protein
MTAFSDYLEQKVLGVTLLGSAYTAPSTIYCALATSVTTDGDTFEEPAPAEYSRQVVVFGAPAQAAEKHQVSCSSPVTFTEAATPWGVVTHVGLYDSPTGGNLLYQGALTSVRTVETGDTFQFNAGDLKVQLS